MSASLGLYRLQQVDSQIDRARAQLDFIQKTLENDIEMRNALAKVEEAEKAYHHVKHELRFAESEVQSQRTKIEQTESSLYGGRVQNPKELQDLQKDVASLKKHLDTLEERELEAMLKMEQVENSLSDSRGNLEQIQGRLGSEHKELISQQSTHMRDLERLYEEREAAVNPIEGSLLAIYENLRKQKRGVAVTVFNDNTCASCGATLNAAIQQNARSSKQLAHCPTCGRILYAS